LEKIEYLSKFEKRNIILIQQNDKLEEENDILRAGKINILHLFIIN